MVTETDLSGARLDAAIEMAFFGGTVKIYAHGAFVLDDQGLGSRVRTYSQKLDAAWKVMAALSERFPSVLIEDTTGPTVTATFQPSHFYESLESVGATGDTAAEAICRAALKALDQ